MSLFDETRLAALRMAYAPHSFARADLLQDAYLLATHGPYRVYYGPIGAWPLENVRVIFVGLTPGFAQLEAAARIFLASPESIRSSEAAYSDQLRRHVAFAGTMRRNLCRMLDDLGIPGYFNIARSDELFGENRNEIAATSALVLPVFKGPILSNFSGVKDLSRVSLFRDMLMALLLPRLKRAPEALIVPFGLAAESGLRFLVREGQIDDSRVLTGFPHPSGANGHRKKLFERNQNQLRAALGAWAAKK